MSASSANSRSHLRPETQSLVVKAFQSVQNDFELQLQESNDLLQKKIDKIVQDMNSLKTGMKSAQKCIEHMHRMNPNAKRMIEEFNERLKSKDGEIEQLQKQLAEFGEEHTERIDELTTFKTHIEEEMMKASAESPTAQTPQENDKEGKVNGNDENSEETSGTEGKNFVFNEAVGGKNVLIGSNLAAVSEGGDMKFLDPLKRNDPNSLLNDQATLAVSEPVKVEVDGTFVGNEQLNLQQNLQKVYISGTKEHNIEVDDDGKKVEYRQADKNELSKFLEKAKEDAERDEDEEPIELSVDEQLQQRDVIIRVADLLKKDGNVEHFIRLCGLLTDLSEKQLRSLAPDLGHITRIDVSTIQIDYKLLSAFFRCFRSKTFHWLLLRSTRILATNMRLLGRSLANCKIGYLDLSKCSFEYMAFFELAAVLLHVDCLILRGITSATIVPENNVGAVKLFSEQEAEHLSDSICRRPEPMMMDLSNCDLRNIIVATALFKCMEKVSSLSLQQSLLTEQTMHAILAPAGKLRKLDLASAELRNPGVKGTAAYLGKVSALILSSVLLDDEGVQPLLEALESLPEKAMDVLDISFNPISSDNVSKFLKFVGKVQVMVFSKEQIISFEKHSGDVADKMILSEVANGTAIRLEEGASADYFTHWVACVQPLEDEQKQMLSQVTTLSQQDVEARTVKDYRCITCKTHVAFTKDAMPTECINLLNDRKLWGVLDQPYFTTVAHAVSCVPGHSAPKKHACATPNCPLARYKVKGCKCAVCKQNLGAYYSRDDGQHFWCFLQESRNTTLVGTSKQCKHM